MQSWKEYLFLKKAQVPVRVRVPENQKSSSTSTSTSTWKSKKLKYQYEYEYLFLKKFKYQYEYLDANGSPRFNQLFFQFAYSIHVIEYKNFSFTTSHITHKTNSDLVSSLLNKTTSISSVQFSF